MGLNLVSVKLTARVEQRIIGIVFLIGVLIGIRPIRLTIVRSGQIIR
ncbi:MAG: hypothetical protein ACI8P3_000384 [Saprospiraceae bacterium]|jgi:hypothetical protein